MEELELTVTPVKKSLFAKIAALSAKTKIITAAGLVAVIGGGSAFAYSITQTPENFVGLALASAFTDKNPSYDINADIKAGPITGSGTLDIATGDLGALLTLKASVDVYNQPSGATLNLLSSKEGDLYASLSDFDSLANFLAATGYIPQSSVTAISAALKDNWIKVSKAELATYTGGNDCLSTKLNNPEYVKTATAELSGAMRNNLFIVPTKELAGSNGDRVFELGINAEKLKGYLTAIKASKYFADIKSCVPSFDIADASIAKINQSDVDGLFEDANHKMTVTLAANSFSHHLSSIVINYEDKSTNAASVVTIKTTGDQSAKVVIPSKTVTVQELMGLLYSPATY